MQAATQRAEEVTRTVAAQAQRLSELQNQLPEAERRLQQARDAQASTETELANARSERDRLARDRLRSRARRHSSGMTCRHSLPGPRTTCPPATERLRSWKGGFRPPVRNSPMLRVGLAEVRQQLATPPSSESPSGAGAPTGVAPATPQP
jgi:septal ring factor EnvC (AmiA/AmiB activator)